MGKVVAFSERYRATHFLAGASGVTGAVALNTPLMQNCISYAKLYQETRKTCVSVARCYEKRLARHAAECIDVLLKDTPYLVAFLDERNFEHQLLLVSNKTTYLRGDLEKLSLAGTEAKDETLRKSIEQCLAHMGQAVAASFPAATHFM